MKRIIVILLILSSSVSCKQYSEEPEPENLEAVRIVAQVQVKGNSTTTTSINQFVVFGYYQEKESWENVKNTLNANFMYNVSVDKVGTSWVSTPQVYWTDKSSDSRYSFFGYSPSPKIDNGLTHLTNATTLGYQKVDYQTLADVENQVDLLVSSRIDQTPAGVVVMKFSHALTRVGLRAYTNIANTKVKSFKITKLAYKGNLDITTPVLWSNISPDKTDFAVTLNPAITVSVDPNNPTDITEQGKWSFILLPQDLTDNTESVLEIVYTQRGVEITKSYTLKQNFPSGRATIFEINLSGTPSSELLVSQVEIADWNLGGKWGIDSSEGDVVPNV